MTLVGRDSFSLINGRSMQAFVCMFFILLLSCCRQDVLAGADTAGRQTGGIRGRLITGPGRQPAGDVQVMMPFLKQLSFSDAGGYFSFSQVPYGTHTMIVGGFNVLVDTIRVFLQSPWTDIGERQVVILESPALLSGQQLPTIALEENEVSTEDEGIRTANISGLLSASRDPFIAAISFVLAPYRFQPRGYSRNTQEVQINGSPMNDVETGDAFWSQWGGLNDVFRSRTNTYGLQAAADMFGGVGGSVSFDASPGSLRKQTRLTYSLTNRSYRSRLVLTRSSGLLKSGWSYAASVSRRWARQGYMPGTFYDGISWYAGVGRRIRDKHELNLVTFGAPTWRGKSAPVTLETVDISGDNFYNPNWGYQQGEKRNAKVSDVFQPVAILSYRYAPSRWLRWNTSISYQYGRARNSSLDYYNGRNPRPDYYRYLPGYYVLANTDPTNPDPGAQAEFHTHQQVDWDRIYQENSIHYDSIVNAEGIPGNTVRGRRSITVLCNDVDKVGKGALNTNVEIVAGEHLSLTGGIQAILQRTESYREMSDLLGGDYYLNLNQFAFQQHVPDQSFNQYDLTIPDRAIREGDKYNYHYISRFAKAHVWLQGAFSYKRLDFFLALRAGFNRFSREGLYRNGLFPDVSYGECAVQRFSPYSFKGGITGKIDGRNYLFVYAAYGLEAPDFENTFISPRTRNSTVDHPIADLTTSVEAGYLMRTPKINIRLGGYATEIRDATEIKRYYNDDPAFRSFVNYAIRGICTRYTGLELAAELRMLSALSLTAVAAIGQAFYTDNPSSVLIYRDNDTVRTPSAREVYIRNYYVAAGPQSAYTLGLSYRAKSYWNAGVQFNYLDRNYVDVSPDRRTEDAVAGVLPGSQQYYMILGQEKLPAVFTIDIAGGKSWLLSKYTRKLPRSCFLYLNIGISNLLGTELRTGGSEQLRYDFSDREPGKFATKYFYGSGRNFFLNISLAF